MDLNFQSFKAIFYKMDERSEVCFIGIGDFFKKKSSNALIITDVHSFIIMHFWMHLGIFSIFEFN